MGLRITTLSENTAGRGLLAEWGLSFFIESDGTTILLDAGKSIVASHNADTLGIDLCRVDKIILSHGHSDHTGGLKQVLRKINKEIEIIAHPDIWAVKYRHHEGKEDRPMGIPSPRPELESLGARFNLTTEPVAITDRIMTSGEIPMTNHFEELDSGLFVREDAGSRPDELNDDLALVIKTEPGLVVILGCAHHGIINTLHHAQKLTGIKPIHAVLGGAHLLYASEERIRLTVKVLKELDVKKLGLCHCTSLPATCVLAREFSERFFFNNTGTVTELP
ncbi:MAG: MBL fold metallo-hydrolase [Dehalococcoidia bacterium]|nr:MAG: MBL fold metallo-hydrolase [Dehalococcoidia bacterium]